MVKVAVIDDDAVARKRVRSVAESISSQIVVSEYESCREFLNDPEKTDLLILDNYLADGEAVSKIAHCQDKCANIVVYSADSRLAKRFMVEGVGHVALAKSNSIKMLEMVILCYTAGYLS
jgi:response regulator of citrate/malate metabolism